MTEHELDFLLTAFVQAGSVTAVDRRLILSALRDGRLDASQLPVPLAGRPRITPQSLLETARTMIGPSSTPLPLAARKRMRDASVVAFEREATSLAPLHNSALARWSQSFLSLTTRTQQAVYVAGRGAMPKAAEAPALEKFNTRQHMYAVRFGLQSVAARLKEVPASVARVAQRSRLYVGEAWANFWRGQRETDAGYGMVVHYRARDDDRTCSPCYDAGRKGPYLPQFAPVPGAVCVAPGHCRCEWDVVFDEEEFKRLGGIV